MGFKHTPYYFLWIKRTLKPTFYYKKGGDFYFLHILMQWKARGNAKSFLFVNLKLNIQGTLCERVELGCCQLQWQCFQPWGDRSANARSCKDLLSWDEIVRIRWSLIKYMSVMQVWRNRPILWHRSEQKRRHCQHLLLHWEGRVGSTSSSSPRRSRWSAPPSSTYPRISLTTTLSLSRLPLRAQATVPCLQMTNLDKLETKDVKEE